MDDTVTSAVKWGVGLALLVILFVLGVLFDAFGASSLRAQARLERAVGEAVRPLNDAVSVRMSGQVAILSGVVESEREREALAAAAKRAASLFGVGAGGLAWGGVTKVDVRDVTVKPPRATPYAWAAEREGDAITLRGLVPDAGGRGLLRARAAAVMPDGARIVDEMTLDPDAPHAHWNDMAAVGLDAMTHLDPARARLEGLRLVVAGEALGEEAAAAARRALRGADNAFVLDGAPARAEATITVTPLPEPEPEPAPEPELEPADEPVAPAPDPEPTPQERAAARAAEVALQCQSDFDAALATNTILFRSSSAAIRPVSLPLLDSLAAIAAQCPEAALTIEGHTDATGAADFNRTLSQERAEAVARYLTDNGVDADRLTAVGFGAGQPAASNATREGRALNRRIEITVSL